MPEREQPYAIIVPKNYPGDTLCDLDDPERRRLNIHVGRNMFIELTGEQPRPESTQQDYAATDVVLPHPVYRAQGWVSIINPGENTYPLAVRLLRAAHEDAERRTLRREAAQHPGGQRQGHGDHSQTSSR